MLLHRREFLLSALAAAGGSLLIPGLSSSKAAPAQQYSRMAYVIGNAAYGAIGCGRKHCSLRSPIHDATDVAAFLKSSGFKVVSYHDLPSPQFQTVISQFSRESALFDVALFYYSGHAVQIDGTNYLLPVDVVDLTFGVEQLVSLDWAIEADLGPDTIGVVVLDACRDNPFVSALANNPLETQQAAIKKGLAPIEPRDRFIVAYSTAADHVAADGDGVGLSPFTKAWLTLAKESGATVKDTFDRVSTSVCDMTTAGAKPGSPPRKDVFCQRPALYTSLGAVPIYWGTTSTTSPAESPLLVSIKMGLAGDPVVQEVLGNINEEFAFDYTWRPAVGDRTEAEIIPDLDYFQTAEARGRPFVMASNNGYYAPEEFSTGWSLSYPILDVIARKLLPEAFVVKELVVESTDSSLDSAPYVDLEAPGTDCCALTIINNSWEPISQVELEFDVVGRGATTYEELLAYVDSKPRDARYGISYVAKGIDRYEDFDLKEVLAPHVDDLNFFALTWGRAVEEDSTGRVTVTDYNTNKKVKLPAGFKEWYQKNKGAFESTDLYTLNIAGRMKSSNRRGETQVADFAAMLLLIAPGVGGGALEYDLHERIKLPVDGKNHNIHKAIGKKLTKAGDVFRGIVALVPEKSSYHRLRFTIVGDQGPLYQSPWVKAHIIVSRNDKEAVVAIRQ